MFEKCIKCTRMGESCVPNLILLPFSDLIHWCSKRQKFLEWTNQDLAERSGVPIGTINRIKAGDYMDCRYSTIQHLLITLIGGTTDELSCTAQVEKELQTMEAQAAQISALAQENETLKERLNCIDAQHRCDIRAVKEEYQGQISFLIEELKAWRSLHQK